MLPNSFAEQWHPTLNGELSVSNVSAGSNRKVWWLGECGHEFQSRVFSRVKGSGCPVCSGKVLVPGVNDLATTHPDAASQWHPEKNGSLLPSDVSAGVGRKVWWVCGKGHEWESFVSNRVKKNSNKLSSCPVCVNKLVLPGVNDVATTHPDLVLQWHPTKNTHVSPSEVSAGYTKPVWWVCGQGHEWEATVANRVKKQTGCRFCAGYHDEDTRYIGDLLASQWHPTKNYPLSPSDVSKGSDRLVWWVGECKHEWEATVSSRALANKGCGYCSNNKVLLHFNDLATSHPDLAAEFHPDLNGFLTAHEVVAGSKKSVFWLCQVCGHEWEALVESRGRGSGCPSCALKKFNYVSKPEKDICDFLVSLDLTVEKSNRSVLAGKEIDLYVPEKNFGVEFNGLHWHSEPAGKNRTYHYGKWLAAKEAGVQLVQVWEDDWNIRRNVVLKSLAYKLGVYSKLAERHPDLIVKPFKVQARKTVVQVLTKVETEVFLEANHIQGYSTGSYYLGLKSKDDNTLLAVLVLKKEAGTDGKTLNIIRYATSTNVVGGFTKLLTYAERTYKPESFITFSDHCLSDGGLYENNGFVADKELDPDYMYVVNGERKHKFGYRLKRFRNDPGLLYEEGLTERELAALNNLPRIWDAGKTRWVKKV